MRMLADHTVLASCFSALTDTAFFACLMRRRRPMGEKPRGHTAVFSLVTSTPLDESSTFVCKCVSYVPVISISISSNERFSHELPIEFDSNYVKAEYKTRSKGETQM